MARVRAYSFGLTPSFLRRVIGPSSVQSQRGHHTHFSVISDVGQVEPGGLQATLLADWVQPVRLPESEGAYVFDCSSKAVLEHPLAQRLMAACVGTLVPTEELGVLARAYALTVRVSPTLIHSDWLFSVRILRPERPILYVDADGALEQLDMLREYAKRCPEVLLYTTSRELAEALPGRGVWYQETVAEWPHLVRSAFLAYFPTSETTTDPIRAYEFALCSTPSVLGSGLAAKAGLGIAATSSEKALDQLTKLTQDDARRTRIAIRDLAVAKTLTAVQGADAWERQLDKLIKRHVPLPPAFHPYLPTASSPL